MNKYELEADENGFFYFNRRIKDDTTEAHFHSSIELLFCLNGTQTLSVSGEERLLKAGEACFIDSYTVHSLEASGAEMIVLLSDRAYFEPIFASIGQLVPPAFFCFKDKDLLTFIYDFYIKNKDVPCKDALKKSIVGLIVTDISRETVFLARRKNKQNDLVCEILYYTANNYSSDVSLSSLSTRFGYSREYLSRLLHRYIGINWNTYVSNLRAKEAHALITSHKDKLTVTEIALRCGFESLNTFYRAYRRVFEKSPLE